MIELPDRPLTEAEKREYFAIKFDSGVVLRSIIGKSWATEDTPDDEIVLIPTTVGYLRAARRTLNLSNLNKDNIHESN